MHRSSSGGGGGGWAQVELTDALVFNIARTEVHQNFLASKYDIKQHSGAT